MKTHFLFLFLYLVTVQAAIAQKEANVWFFGNSIFGRSLDFNTDPVTISDTNSFRPHASNAVICDSSGNLLFVSYGETVFDKNLNPLPNSQGILGHKHCAQGALLTKKPGSDSLYYLFTNTTFHGASTTTGGNIYWHLIDRTLNNGLGAVVVKNQLLITNTCGKMIAAPHANGSFFWLIASKFRTHNYRSVLVTDTGFALVVQSNHHIQMSACVVRDDFLKYHPPTKKVGSACELRGVVLLDFNDLTGQLINPVYFPLTNSTFLGSSSGPGGFGIEFSPSGRYVYVTQMTPRDSNNVFIPNCFIRRIDLAQPVGTFLPEDAEIVYYGPPGRLRSLQLGPDNRIYVCSPVFGGPLGVINDPDSADCKMDSLWLFTGIIGHFIFTLPNIYTGYLYPPCAPPAVSICPVPAVCAGDTVTLCVSGSGSVLWSPNYNLQDATAATTLAWPETTTVYTVTLTQGIGCTATDSVTVVVDRISTTACPVSPICAGDTAWLCASGDGSYLWSPNYNLHNAASGGTLAWPETTTVYTVTLTLGNGCTATDSVTVIVHQNSPPTFEDTTIRKGEPFGEFYPTADTTIRYHYLNQYGCDSTVYWEVRIDTFNSVNSYQLTVNSVVVFPNPVRGVLYVKHTNQNAAFRLYNKLGQVVIEQQNLPPGTAAVSLSGLAEGVYFWEYSLVGKGERVFGKVVKVN